MNTETAKTVSEEAQSSCLLIYYLYIDRNRDISRSSKRLKTSTEYNSSLLPGKYLIKSIQKHSDANGYQNIHQFREF